MSFLFERPCPMTSEIIHAENLTYSYSPEEPGKNSLEELSLSIQRGEFAALIGRNGSGKTTLARLINTLLEIQEGSLTVASLDAHGSQNIWKIREKTGMVFQNPDNQFVSSIIAEDLAFGPRNFGIPEVEIQKRIQTALARVGMSGYEDKSPHLLSGGQKQRIAIAGILAYDPDILIFDEATAMLDPQGRQDVLATIRGLRRDGKTILMITHAVEETVEADRIFVISHGKISGTGTPREILSNRDLLSEAGLIPPLAVQYYFDLRAHGRALPFCPLTMDELAEALCQ